MTTNISGDLKPALEALLDARENLGRLKGLNFALSKVTARTEELGMTINSNVETMARQDELLRLGRAFYEEVNR